MNFRDVPCTYPKKRSIIDIVAALATADDDLADPNFDPAELVQSLHDKVDACQATIGRMEAVADWLKAMAQPLMAKAAALTTNRQKLRDFVTEALLIEKANRMDDELVSLPGNFFKVRLRDSPAALVIDRLATAADHRDFPDFVTMTVSYDWKNDAIKKALKAGELSVMIPARLSVGHWPEFRPNIPEQLERKKRK